MEFEDGLILGVAAVIAVNKAFISTGLKNSRALYVFVQAFDVGAVLMLFFARVFPEPRLDYAIRAFLMLFVAWHMVLNSQTRAAMRAPTPREQLELEAARKELEETLRRERDEEEAERAGAEQLVAATAEESEPRADAP